MGRERRRGHERREGVRGGWEGKGVGGGGGGAEERRGVGKERP